MNFRVDYLIRERVDASEQVSSLAAAKLLAVNSVEMKTHEAAEVRDAIGTLLFRHPRTVSKA